MKKRISNFFNKAFIFLSKNVNITQINYNTDNIKLLEIYLENLTNDFEKELSFKDILTSLNDVKNKTNIPSEKLVVLLFEANFYYKIEDFIKANKIIKYLEENFYEETKNSKEFYKLKFQINSDQETKNILIYNFGESSEELSIDENCIKGKYLDFIELCEKKNRKDIRYFILKLFYSNTKEDKEKYINKIKSIIEEENSFIKLYVMTKVIDNFFKNFQFYLKDFLKSFVLEYINIFENKVNAKDLDIELENKNFLHDLVNNYISSKFLFIKEEKEKIEILQKYKKFLDPFNNIELLLIQNKGYKGYINSLNKESNITPDEILTIISSLFVNKKYKYILKICRELSLENLSSIENIRIFSKILLKLKLKNREYIFLKEKALQKESLEFIFYNFYLFKINEINFLNFKEIITEILEDRDKESSLNDISIIILLRLNYSIETNDKFWIINYFIDRQNEYRRFIPEIINLISEDEKISGMDFENFINRIDLDNENINFTSISKAYRDFKNPKNALKMLYKKWNNVKDEETANNIFSLCLIEEKYDEEIYNFFKEKNNTLEKKFLLSVFLLYEKEKEGIIEINKLFLNTSNKELKEISILIIKFYFKNILNHKSLVKNVSFENTMYKIKDKLYIPDIYFKGNANFSYEKMDLDKFDIFQRENTFSKINLLEYLISTFITYIGGLDKFITDIPGFKRVSIAPEDKAVSIIDTLEEISGEKELKTLRNKYLKIEDSESKKKILMNTLYINYFQLNIFLDDFIAQFNENFINRNVNKNNVKKIISIESILFLYKLDLLEIIKILDNVFFQKSTYNFFKEAFDEPSALSIIKILDDIKDIKMKDDENINTIYKNKEISPYLNRLIYITNQFDFDYISEDRNLKILNPLVNSYSVIYIIYENYSKIKENKFNFYKFNLLLLKLNSKY